MQRSLVLIKPDAVQRCLIGPITTRLEQRGLKLIGMKALMVSQELAERHYAAHKGKPFYAGLVKYIVSSPVVAMVWEGVFAVDSIRKTMGSTKPGEAEPGSIRHDYASKISRNLTHASDSPESAEKEIALWFKEEEIMQWDRAVEEWITGNN
ncbi:MAG: nucleoside-diphosphate kinase [Anaerolineaceae bacterium]|nr:nucleoside-diphosphate kinase [Anaerolineaceae bacterium]